MLDIKMSQQGSFDWHNWLTASVLLLSIKIFEWISIMPLKPISSKKNTIYETYMQSITLHIIFITYKHYVPKFSRQLKSLLLLFYATITQNSVFMVKFLHQVIVQPLLSLVFCIEQHFSTSMSLW